MRGLMVAVVGMGILIVAGVTVIVVTLVNRMSAVAVGNESVPNGPVAAMVLDEPSGTHVTGSAVGGDRLTVQLGGGGPDRVVIVDLKSGRVVGRVGLAR